MAALPCYDGMYRGWGKIIAANGVAVVMVTIACPEISRDTARDLAAFCKS
jgi:hypothetical protein